MIKKVLSLFFIALVLAACDSQADKIGKADTAFRMLGKNDRIEIEAFDDLDIKGISCYLSYSKKGGLKETVNLEEDLTYASVSCVQTAPVIEFNIKTVEKPVEVFKRRASAVFKSMQIVRYYDPKRYTFSYLVYSDRILDGSPKNSLSTISCFTSPPVVGTNNSERSNQKAIGSCLIEGLEQ